MNTDYLYTKETKVTKTGKGRGSLDSVFLCDLRGLLLILTAQHSKKDFPVMKTILKCIGTICLPCFSFGLLALAADAPNPASYTQRLLETHFFRQPLVWVGPAPPTEAESQDLWDILEAGRPEDADTATGNLQGFLTEHPNSSWAPALQEELGDYFRRNGYFSQALDNWQAAWDSTWQETNRNARVIADGALVQELQLLASLGRTDTMSNLFEQTQQRRLTQPIAWRVPPILNDAGAASWSSRPCNSGRCFISCIRPNASGHGPPTSRLVQVNRAEAPNAFLSP